MISNRKEAAKRLSWELNRRMTQIAEKRQLKNDIGNRKSN
jgi:hypothetical protein